MYWKLSKHANEPLSVKTSGQLLLHIMRGVLVVCVIYMLLPITLIYLFSLFSSGFPIGPVLIGLAVWWSRRQDKRR
jgi:hypothetical protein